MFGYFIHKVPANEKSTLRLPSCPSGFWTAGFSERQKSLYKLKNQILKLKYDKTPDNQRTLFHGSNTVLSNGKYEFYPIYFPWDSHDILKL
jgi:hypothetical protein